MRDGLAALFALVVAAAIPLATWAQELEPRSVECTGLMSPLPRAEGVADPVFAILVGLVEADRFGCLDAARLADELRRARRATRLPYQTLRDVQRIAAGDGNRATVRIHLDRDLVAPIPYRLLFYHPGRIRVAAALELNEWTLHDATSKCEPGKDDDALQTIGCLRLFEVTHGRLEVDIDGWLDALAGPRLDDTELTGLALFRLQGRWWGAGFGRNRRRAPRVGLFDLGADEIVFPMPQPMRPLVRRLRDEVEARRAATVAAHTWDRRTARP